MRVLVTGANGHVGGACVNALRTHGHEVIGTTRSGDTLAGVARCVPLDLTDANLAAALKGSDRRCDAIVHCAASMDFAPDAAHVVRANCIGTHALVNVAREWGSVPFVFISSVGVIGSPVELPVVESHPVRPGTVYHATKVFGEILIGQYRDSGAQGVSLRISSPVGPGMRHRRIFPLFADAASKAEVLRVSDPERRQDYVDARDIAGAVAASLESGISGLFNVASGRAVSNLDLAKRAISALASSSKIECPDPGTETSVSWEISISAAAAAFGYTPKISLEESVRDYVAHETRRGSEM